jgi:hypothetical protein
MRNLLISATTKQLQQAHEQMLIKFMYRLKAPKISALLNLVRVSKLPDGCVVCHRPSSPRNTMMATALTTMARVLLPMNTLTMLVISYSDHSPTNKKLPHPSKLFLGEVSPQAHGTQTTQRLQRMRSTMLAVV